jgi:WD40 repeat protein
MSECTEWDAAWFADGKRIASVSHDGKVMITDITKAHKTKIRELKNKTYSRTCAVSKSMTMIAYGVNSLCNIHTLNNDNSWTSHPVIEIDAQWSVNQIKFLDEDKVVVFSSDGTASIYDLETQTKLLSLHHDSDKSTAGSVLFHCMYWAILVLLSLLICLLLHLHILWITLSNCGIFEVVSAYKRLICQVKYAVWSMWLWRMLTLTLVAAFQEEEINSCMELEKHHVLFMTFLHGGKLAASVHLW